MLTYQGLAFAYPDDTRPTASQVEEPLPTPTTTTSNSPTIDPTTNSEQLIAEYNGHKVLRKDIAQELQRPELVMLSQSLEEERDKQKKLHITALMSIISRNLLLEAARTSKTATTVDLSKEIDAFIAAQGGNERLTPLLNRHNMPWDKFINELREGLLLKRYVEDEVASYASVSDDDIMKAFKRNPTAFDIPEKARARHILFRIESDNVDDTEGRAKQALERITSGATSFEEYATNYSDDKVTAQRGGDLGEFSRGTMLPEFDTAVFSLEPGAISTPIKTKYGIHLIKVEQKTPKVIATLENSKELVRQKLITQARAEALSKHIQTLQDKAVIVVIDPAYRLKEPSLSENP